MTVIGKLLVNLGLNPAEFEKGMKQVQGTMASVGKAFAALGGVAVFTAFSAGIGQAVGRIEDMRKLTAQLDKALENTGNTARTSGKEIADFADELERSTGRAAKEVLEVGTNLATFGFSREVFFDAIKLADDMSAAWGGDLKQNAEGLGRALDDPVKGLAMLTKRGITFTDEQKNMIAGFMKANDIIGAQGVVMDALNAQVKGVAASGFSGLTKASANASKALGKVFETMANAMGVNTGLEMSLTAVAAALDFVSQNFDVIARGAGVAGAAILTALGPAIWATVSTAAGLMVTTVIGGIRAIGAAIAMNPIGFLITAIAAAVTAAFLFRDEIKQAIGVDFVGIVGDAINWVIGAFVGGFNAIRDSWGLLPNALGDLIYQAAEGVVNGVIWMIREVQVSINGFLAKTNGLLAKMGSSIQIDHIALMDYADLGNPYAGAADQVGEIVSKSFADAKVDYLGELVKALGLVGEEAAGATSNIAGLGAALDGAGTDGGAAGGAKKLGSAADETKSKLQQMGDMGKSVASTIADGFKDIFKSVVTGSGNAMDAVRQLLGKLGELFLDQAFNLLIGGFGGGGGGLFSGIGKLFGFERGGTIMPGGSGGIDSQLVTFRKSPNERVDITKPGQTLSTGQPSLVMNQNISLAGAMSPTDVASIAKSFADGAVKEVKKALPGWQVDNQRRM